VAENSKIEWTDHTFNPWWGCQKISPACDRCYAEAQAHRWGHELWGKYADRRQMSESHWRKPLVWNEDAEKEGVSRLVFCASMADVFEDRQDLYVPRARLWELIAETWHLDWLLLTKRPENIDVMMPFRWQQSAPLNVWVGATAENQKLYHERVAHLAGLPFDAFLSLEPLLEPIDLQPEVADFGRIKWVIVGGETGPGARPMDPDWAREIRDQCAEYGVAFFMKQMTNRAPIPQDLMIRQFPGS
jgi:protein gp37